MATKPKDFDRCPKCNKLTESGLRQTAEYAKEHPIWDTDMTKPLPELIEEIRRSIAYLRGNLYDIGRAYPMWDQQLEDVRGLLTCGLVTLNRTRKEMTDHEKRKQERENEQTKDR